MNDAVKKLKKLHAKRIFVQFPEGLKMKIQEIAKELEKKGFEVILSLESTWGGCDIREHEAKLLRCDAILHIAHEDYGIKTKIPVVYWEYFFDVNPVPVLEKDFDKLKDFQKIGIVTSLQYVKTIPKVKDFLEKRGKKVFVNKSLKHPGQVLGCNLSAGIKLEKKVDCFLCISAGKFYSLGLIFKTGKPTFNLDLENQQIYQLDDLKMKILKIIEWNKSELKDAKRIGLLVSWKKGQMFGDPFKMKKQLEKQGKEVYILAMDELSKSKIEGLKLDFLINFSCPRIGTDDLEKFSKPILNWNDVPLK
ncbi:MAG: diphthamide biosynthesis enzyme Dph2 [Candidatus Aenigmatarchaeota archaeon]